MDYEIVWGGDPEDVCVTTSGDASVDDLHRWVNDVLADHRFRQHLRILIDHRQTRWWTMSNDEVRRRAALLIGQRERVGSHSVAFVVGSPVDAGIGNVLKSLVDGQVHYNAEIFDSLVAGRAWLAAQPSPHS
jgi:hypothetical protein